MTYSWVGKERIIIDHTAEGEGLRRQNREKRFIRKAVDFAPKKPISIIPPCPFTRSVFDKNDTLRDVIWSFFEAINLKPREWMECKGTWLSSRIERRRSQSNYLIHKRGL